MSEQVGELPAAEPDEPAPRRRRRWPWVLAGVLVVLAVVLGGLWLARERLADQVIARQLKQMNLPARYQVESIGPRRQVLVNVAIGNPAAPDFTAERVVVEVEPTFGVPAINRITLVRPRLYGRYRDGKPSFGVLDKYLFTGSKEPFRLPDMTVALVDGRARMETDYGLIGAKLDGAGALRDGFSGIAAVTAPSLTLPGCTLRGATAYGAIKVVGERPRFTGPLRFDRAACPAQQLVAGKSAVQLDLKVDKLLDGVEGTADLAAASVAVQGQTLAALDGTTRFAFRRGDFTADYALGAAAVQVADFAIQRARLTGQLRTRDGLAQLDSEGQLNGRDLRLTPALDAALASAARSAEGTFAAPMLTQIRTSLAREARGSALTADFSLRQTGAVTSLVIPRANWKGGSGGNLITLSRFEMTAGGRGSPRFAANFVTGGAGLPQATGRMEQRLGGTAMMRLEMKEYRAGDGRLELPQLMLAQAADGSIGFAGTARLSGPLPGGSARNLVLPLDGNWSAARGLAIWRGCVPVQFDALAYANLTLDRRALTLCPGPDGAIVRSDARGLRVAAGAAALTVSGRLGTTPIRIVSGPVGFAVPGTLAARKLDVALGPDGTAARFQISNLTARVGQDIAGRFADTEVRLGAVPLDILAAQGAWRYAGGKLTLSEGAFRLEDRELADRFKPLIARDATLALIDSKISAQAILREPLSDREVVTATIAHNLANGVGSADIGVAGIRFDQAIQPDTLTPLALGVIANARGVIAGTGRIDWNQRGVTSTGRFSTDRFDFAAAFGPVEGVSGTVEFTDLLGLVTAPDQRLKIATINPGIEVNDGTMSFQLEPDGVLMVNGATWPFIDGTLELLPSRMVLGAAELRRFEIRVEGANSAKFVERLELGNLTASGIFDGKLPLVFDENGGRIEGGFLMSRPPGGNVSYVGALTYEDMGAMANFAFEALRSLDYKVMTIGMDGALEGEIVTRITFDGVKQGATAKRNFITQRIAQLPIRFNVNIRAPFFQLISSFKAMYDPSRVRDPRTLGLVGADGKPLPPGATAPLPDILPPDIQPSESRNSP